ncbi:MAG TPA: hypothetical protein VFP26_00980 [Gemmatimonadaceae bacterium]|jgi:hypothetical protein|nr:hypothetical protein [Gemmatimonadaceae bacterium]
MKKLVGFAALSMCGACYQYAAFQPTTSTLGQAVRVQLTDAGTARVASLVGPGASYLDGNLASLTDSSYTIAVTDLGRLNGTEETWKGEQATVYRSEAASIELRKAAPGRSAALTAALVGGAALVARAMGAGEGAIRTRVGGGSTGQ